MFARTKELLRRLEDRQNKLEEAVKAIPQALNEALSNRSPTSEPTSALIEGFGKAFAAMAESSARTNETISHLMSDSLERANRIAVRKASIELADRSREVREEKKQKIKQLPAWVASCEECLAYLHEREPRHKNDLIRHSAEEHMAKLAKFRDQLNLFNGAA